LETYCCSSNSNVPTTSLRAGIDDLRRRAQGAGSPDLGGCGPGLLPRDRPKLYGSAVNGCLAI
jgi:hypothetical protein